ncbi:hypothetical protein Lser_V15G45229 [Lactuca serriola]
MVNAETISNAAILEMFYQIGYKEALSAVSKFKKPNLPPTWNALFSILFKAFSRRVTGNDCASKLFMSLMYGLYTGKNVDYGSILWAQLMQSTHSVTRHSEISCARFLTIIVNKALQQLKIPVMSDAMMASIGHSIQHVSLWVTHQSFPSWARFWRLCFLMFLPPIKF